MLITLLKLKCARKSEELKVKGSERRGWNKITVTLNEELEELTISIISNSYVLNFKIYQ